MIDPVVHLLCILVMWLIAVVLRRVPAHVLLALGGIIFLWMFAPAAAALILFISAQAVLLVALLRSRDRKDGWRKYGAYLLLPNLLWVDVHEAFFSGIFSIFAVSFSVIRIFMTAKQLLSARKAPPLSDCYWIFCAGFFLPALMVGPVFSGTQIRDQHRAGQLTPVTLRDYRLVLAGCVLAVLVSPFFQQVADTLRMMSGFIAAPTLFLSLFAAFWGQSLIAEHSSRFFGYELPVNFRHPWKARNIREFWNRWHRSMAQFVMQYIYLPLTLNGIRPRWAVLFSFMFMGLWHNVSLGYFLWGVGHGLLLGFWPQDDERHPLFRHLRTLITWTAVISLSYMANYGSLA